MHQSASDFFLSLLLLSLVCMVFSAQKTANSLLRSKNSKLTNLNQFFCSSSSLVRSSSTIITKKNLNNWHSPHLFSKILQPLSIRHLSFSVFLQLHSNVLYNQHENTCSIPSPAEKSTEYVLKCFLLSLQYISTSKYLVWAFYNYSQRNSFRLLDFTQHISISDACSILNVLCSFSKSSNSLVWTFQRLATTRHLTQIKYSLAYNLPDDLRFSVFLQTRELHNLASDLKKKTFGLCKVLSF